MRLAIIFLNFWLYAICANVEEQFKELFVIPDYTVSPLNFSTKCFDGLGCYYNGPPFYDPEFRPVSLLPSNNPRERIEFLLFTPFNKEDSQNYTFKMTKESLENSHFNPQGMTIFWIHGWQPYLNSTDELFRVKDAIFDHLESHRYKNFFAVKWANYIGDSYDQALANGRVVGTMTAKLIEFLMSHTSAKKESFHIIGHSIGGQIVAYVGQEIPGLHRITALDATESHFLHTDKMVRLDPSDANFVDVIHANGGYNPFEGLGYPEPYGHQDFYPNGGRIQPGCGNPPIMNITDDNVLRLYFKESCDHRRSVDYFLESIVNSNCTFKGVSCDSYDNWKKGKCPPTTHQIAVMGIHAKPIPKLPLTKFYLDTRTSKPFCRKNGYQKPTTFQDT